MNKPSPSVDPLMVVKVRETKVGTRRIKVKDKPDPVAGNFLFDIEVTAVSRDIFLPLSIASGKKPTGFVYQIEGTDQGSISTTDISAKGDGVTQVTLGTLHFCKIPAGKTASLRIRVEVRGRLDESYQVTIRQINYKFNPGDARYHKTAQDLRSRVTRFL